MPEEAALHNLTLKAHVLVFAMSGVPRFDRHVFVGMLALRSHAVAI